MSTNERPSALMELVARPRPLAAGSEVVAPAERREAPLAGSLVAGVTVEQLLELLGQHPRDGAPSFGGEDLESAHGVGRERERDVLLHVKKCNT